MNREFNQDLLVKKGWTVQEWIDECVNKYGPENFYNIVEEDWDLINKSVKDSILTTVKSYIKPSKIETIEDLAKLLDGNEYQDELINQKGIDVIHLCKEKGWIVVYGASDDLMEIDGAICDELGAWEGCVAKFYKKGEFYPEYEEEDVYHKSPEDSFFAIDDKELTRIKTEKEDALIIESMWCPIDSDVSWQINCKGAPHVSFNVMEDDEVYCEALVIDISKFISK